MDCDSARHSTSIVEAAISICKLLAQSKGQFANMMMYLQ